MNVFIKYRIIEESKLDYGATHASVWLYDTAVAGAVSGGRAENWGDMVYVL